MALRCGFKPFEQRQQRGRGLGRAQGGHGTCSGRGRIAVACLGIQKGCGEGQGHSVPLPDSQRSSLKKDPRSLLVFSVSASPSQAARMGKGERVMVRHFLCGDCAA